ncbi:hypothetical protein L6R53_10020 [Myxococcota bacterium]|nr:hypothetical protein [Myxococcota bacterium]
MPPRLSVLLPALLALGLLGAVAVTHPELRHVDFVAFAGRARRVLEGQDLLSPRYPVGYPLVLGLAKVAAGRVLLAGKLLSVAAGVALVAAVARWLGALPAAWLAAQAPLLTWGSTEGTDLPAIALAVGALAIAAPSAGPRRAAGARRIDPRPLCAGLLAGAAVMTRYPAAVVVPALLLALVGSGPGRARAVGLALLGLALATAPHWLCALAGLGPLLPDPRENAAIGAGGGPPSPALPRWWAATGRGLRDALSTWPTWVGLGGLLLGLLRRDRRAAVLLAWGAGHAALLGLFFSNPRLSLPTTLAASLGAAFLPRWLLPPLSALALWGAWPQLLAAEPGVVEREALIAAAAGRSGPVAATSPWFHLRRADGWIEAPLFLMDAVPPGTTPGNLAPAHLRSWCQERGVPLVAVDAGRLARTFPGLRPLASGPVEGFTEIARSPGWRLLEVQAREEAP